MQIKTMAACTLLGPLGGLSTARGQGEQIYKLLAEDGVAGDHFGISVAISGTTVVVGAEYESDNGNQAGAAYLFDALTGTQTAKLIPSDGTELEWFGTSVAISGTTAIIGTPGDGDNGTFSGSAYLFNTATGQQLFKLLPSDGAGFEFFGGRVAIDGSVALVGAHGHDDDGSGAGAAFLFDTNTGLQTAELLPSDGSANDLFGLAVAMTGTTALVGAKGDDDNGSNSGSAYLFDTSTGTQLFKLLPGDGAADDGFGYAVDIDGTLAIVSAPENDDNGINSGSVYLFDVVTGQQLAKIVADDGASGDAFGYAVALSGPVAVVGANSDDDVGSASGSVYLYDISDPANPIQVIKFVAGDGQEFDSLGSAVAVDGNTAITGAWLDDDNGDASGSAYTFNAALDTDTDGDGLLDSWETDGIPYIGADGTNHLYILDVDGDGISDADPGHKDLFVEMDMMNTLGFSQDAVDMVVDAFWAAPVPNPDGIEGITLHIIIDEDTIQFEETTATPGSTWPADAAQLKSIYFGTITELLDEHSVELLEAKAKAYRYGILYNKASTKIGGLGELGGDDFVLFAGTYDDESKAAVFMHELGHNLNLHHGGGDEINGKPNYPSIMNYVHSYRETWNNNTWKLDYSRERLATLNENSLDDPVGIGLGGSGYYADFVVPYFTVVTDGADCYFPNEWNQPAVAFTKLDPANTQDYNLDCDKDDTGLVGDLNHLDNVNLPGSGDPSPGETLEGYDDLASIVLPVSDGGGAFAGTVPSDEVTEDQRVLINEVFPRVCTGDWNVDGEVNTQDFLAYLNDWAAGNGQADLNADGVVNTQDFLAFLNAWVAGCS